MTNFIYNMQDELFDLNMILPVGKFSPIKKLVDHIEAQGKQLRELNAAIAKKNATIEKYEREKKELQNSNNYLGKKVNELNQGIRDSRDLTWKQKYEALLNSSEQAIGALQKKCQEYKNAESDATANLIETLVKENKELKEEVNLYIGVTNTKNEEVEALAKAVRCPWGNNAEIISAKTARIKELEENVKQLDARIKELVILCDEEYDKNKELEEKNKKIERSNLDLGDTIGLYIEEFNKLKAKNKDLLESKKIIEKRCREAEKALEMEKQISNNKIRELDEYMTKCNNLERNNAILSEKVKEINNLAESIVMLCDDEE